MRKIRILSIILLIFSTAVFGAFKIYERMNQDGTPPVISCGSEELVLSVEALESDLLKDVKAVDDRSGDVSDSLVVESLSGFTEDGVRNIVYAAIDQKGNVARYERVLRYEDYEKPAFSLTGPLRFPKGHTINVLGRVRAESVLDGDLSGNIKYALDSTIDVMNTGIYPVEFRVMDSGGNMVYLTAELEVYDSTEERLEPELTDYLIYLDRNERFDPMDYYVDPNEEEEALREEETAEETAPGQEITLQIASAVDTGNPGTYYVDYYVENEFSSGKTRLIVIVNE